MPQGTCEGLNPSINWGLERDVRKGRVVGGQEGQRGEGDRRAKEEKRTGVPKRRRGQKGQRGEGDKRAKEEKGQGGQEGQ